MAALAFDRKGSPGANIAIQLGLQFLPALVLLICAIAKPHWALWAGVIFQLAMVALLRLIGRGQGWQPLGTSALILYWTAIGWLFLGSGIRELSDPRFNLALAILLVVSVVVFGLQILADSGAQEIRNARMLAQRLEDRKDWPADLASCCDLPEVKELREAVHNDPVPALAMLLQPRPQVRMAALAALEFRKHWEPGQAELVLSVAQHAPEPEVRAGAIMALANMEDRLMVDRLADYLCDPSQGVRRAATEALLWNSEKRWTWIRPAVRKALCDAVQEEDGPLIPNGQLLSSDAVNDLTAWSAEKGVMAIRAALTLGAHYERLLNQERDEQQINDRTRPIIDGSIRPDGIDLIPTVLHPSEMFWRQLHFAEFDVSEMSLSSLLIDISRGDSNWVALPVFTSRSFFHTGAWIRTDRGIDAPEQLKGKQVGVPEYQQTAALWSRGVLQHEFGVSPKDVEWHMERTPERVTGTLSDSRPAGTDCASASH